jgi:hydroxymethylglutaryl-CoA lyase
VDLPASVEIVEVGPRDGLQNEAANVPTPEKIALIEAGLKRFEATSFVSPRAIPQLAEAEDVLAGLHPHDGQVYGGLIPNERGYERAKAAGVGEVVLVGAASESYCRKNLNRSVDEVLAGTLLAGLGADR